MRKTLTTLIAAAFASSLSFGSFAADDSYKAARKQANDDYKAAIAQCKTMKGKEKSTCEKDAKVKRNGAIAQAKAARKADRAANKSEKSSSGSTAAPATTPPATTTK
jgi:hyperosmotically inducible periplasmic protein